MNGFTSFFKKKTKRNLCVAVVAFLMGGFSQSAWAQLSKNPNKFLGNITTGYSVDVDGISFASLWNQITPENESKWGSVEGSRRGQFNWGGFDNCYNYAKNHKFPCKLHCLIWGAQYPGWIDNLSKEEQYKAIVEWFDAAAKRYPDLPLIDVVNEAIPGHQPARYKDALGGDGKTGYDWIIKAFEMAHERWPNAILIYNDYNTFQWQKTEFINLVKILRDAGAPIDAYGCQSHDLTDMSLNNFKSAMTEIHNALQMPMYSTEYDIGTSDDNLQLQRYKEQIPYMWEQDYVAGITLWGYIYGRTWTTDGNSGIIRNGKDRPAMTWLREYMASDAANAAKGPFEGGYKKEASVYVKPASIRVGLGEDLNVEVRARLRTKTIEKVELYANNVLKATFTEAPYTTTLTPDKKGTLKLTAKVYATDGTMWDRISNVTVHEPRSTFAGEIELPGTLQAENFDVGGEGVTFHDSDSNDEEKVGYRTNNGGIDIVRGNGGYAIGYTNSGEWMEYTVNVKQAGVYAFEAWASSGVTNSSFKIELSTDAGLVPLTETLPVTCVTQNSWDTYRANTGRLLIPLEEGKQIIRITIVGSTCNIDKVIFRHVDINPNLKLTLTANPSPITIGDNTTISVKTSLPEDVIKYVEIYANDSRIARKTVAPYECTYKPTAVGTVQLRAVAVDTAGAESEYAEKQLVVQKRRTPHKGVKTLPGIIEVEDFDGGDEGLSYHDSDTEDEGKVNYRTDNGGVDIVTGNGGYGIGYTQADEWLEYTVNVTEAGTYSYEATVSSGLDNSGFRIGVVKDGKVTAITNKITVPNTGDWETYRVVKGNFTKPLEEGQQIFRITISNAYCNIDKINVKLVQTAGVEEIIANEEQTVKVYSLMGTYVGDMKLSANDDAFDKLCQMTGRKGMFILKNQQNGKARQVLIR